MIAKSRHGGALPVGQMAKHSLQLRKCCIAPVTDKVAGNHQDVGLRSRTIQCRHQILIIDTWSHMKIADLNQPLSCQGSGQLQHGKQSLDDLTQWFMHA
jgi:hypothetical protein